MKKPNPFFLLIICFCFLFNGCNAQPQTNSLKLIASITLPDVSGRIDHLSFDSKHQLIFVAALGNNTIEVVGLKSKKVVHTIKNLHEPQGVVFISESNSIFVANGDNGECNVFDTNTFQKTASIKLSGDADNVRYDAAAKKIYVGYGDGGIAVIDATNCKLLNEIKLDGHPESFQIDKSAGKIYVNVPDKKQIDVIDLNKNVVINKWKMIGATSNFPMALDEQHNRLFIGCRSPATLRVINKETGKDISSISCTGDADDVFYDLNDNLIFVSGGRGFIDVFEAGDTLKRINHIATSSGARTSLLLSSQKTLLLAVPARNGNSAALWIYKINK